MFDALRADQRVRDVPDIGGFAPHDEHFETIVVVQMDMHGGEHVVEDLVL
jgi:hypothetical protein